MDAAAFSLEKASDLGLGRGWWRQQREALRERVHTQYRLDHMARLRKVMRKAGVTTFTVLDPNFPDTRGRAYITPRDEHHQYAGAPRAKERREAKAYAKELRARAVVAKRKLRVTMARDARNAKKARRDAEKIVRSMPTAKRTTFHSMRGAIDNAMKVVASKGKK